MGDLEGMGRSVAVIPAILADLFAMIQAVLAIHEEKQKQDQTVKLWQKRVEGIAYDADDLLNEGNQRRRKVCLFFSFFSNKNVDFLWRIASKVRDFKMKLKMINQEGYDFELRLQMGGGGNTAPLPSIAGMRISQETDSVVGQNVFGRTSEVSQIVETILSSAVNKLFLFVSVVGFGGLGKTTLAKLVYNNQ